MKLLGIITIVFFFSGACGLVYQIVWLRMLGLVFGNTTLAISTVLAAFMAGLGLGSRYFGRWIDRKGRPILVYGALEAGVGFYCLLTPLLWLLIQNIYADLSRQFSLGLMPSSLLRFSLSFILMFIPTFLMGGTLPVIAKFFTRDIQAMARQLGWLYGINTLGAASGVFFASFFAIYRLGVHATLFTAAGVNIAIGVFAILSVKTGLIPTPPPLPGVESSPPQLKSKAAEIAPLSPAARMTLLGFGLSGFCSMAYELYWTKILTLSIGSSTYSFAIMLLTFLSGIALGSLLISALSKRFRINFSVFAFIQLLIAFSVLAGMLFLDRLPFYFLRLFTVTRDSGALYMAGKYLICATVMLVPTVLIGSTFAAIAQLFSTRLDHTGRTIGRAYLVNTIGCILGSFCAGFILVPWLGVQKSFMATAALNLLTGLSILALERRVLPKRLLMAAAGVITVCVAFFFLVRPWSEGVLTANISFNPLKYLSHSVYEIHDSIAQTELLYYKEGLSGIVSVTKKQDDFLTLSINANVDASSGDMFTQLLSAHLPMLLAEKANQVLNIGLGCGATVGAAAVYPCQRIDSVELEAGVIEAAGFFSKENRDVLRNPKVRMITNDGRNFLSVNALNYDVIISEPSSLWMAGIANLFSREQFLLMRSRMNRGGIVCQWLNTYSMSDENIKTIVKTFCSVFPHAQLWNSTVMDLMLIGSNDPIRFDLDAVNRKIQGNTMIQEDLSRFHINDAAGLLSCFLLNKSELESMSRDAQMHTDFRPRLEYSCPNSLYRYEQRVIINREMIQSARKTEYPEGMKLPSGARRLSDFHNSLGLSSLENGFPDQGLSRILLSRKVSPQNQGAALNEGIYLYGKNDYYASISVLEPLVRQKPDSAKGCYYLGQSLWALGKKAEALDAYEKAYANDPKNEEIVFSYVDCLLENVKPEKVIQVLEAYSHWGNLNTSAGIKMANAFLMQRQPERSIEILSYLIAQNPHYYPLYEFAGLCRMLFNDYAGALVVYRQARENLPYHSKNYVNMAEAYRKLNMETETAWAERQAYYFETAPDIGAIQ